MAIYFAVLTMCVGVSRTMIRPKDSLPSPLDFDSINRVFKNSLTPAQIGSSICMTRMWMLP
jgi:hypothetical protein